MYRKLLALLLLLCLLTGCAPAAPAETTEGTSAFTETTVPVTAPSETVNPTQPTESVPATEPTDPVEPTDAPTEPTTPPTEATEPTQPPVTEPPATQPTETDPPETEPTQPSVSPDTLQIISLEMSKRYGESTLLKIGDYEILVDAGEKEDNTAVREMLEAYVTDGVLEMVIGTHAHSDHIGGLSYSTTLASFEVETLIDSGGTEMNKTQVWGNYKKVVDELIAQGTDYYAITDVMGSAMETLEIGDNLTLTFLKSQYYGKKSANVNDTSIGFYIRYYDTYLCMFGDAEEGAEASFMALNDKFTSSSDTVIFKANHHGSAGSNLTDFLAWVEPDYVFISSAIVKTGSAADLGQHPYYEAVSRIAGYTRNVYWNGINGTLHLNVTRQSVTVYGDGRTRSYKYNGATVDAASEKDVTYFQSKWYKTGIDSKGWTAY